MVLLDQSGVTGGGPDPYNVHALFVNMGNMWMERFGNYDCLVLTWPLADLGGACPAHAPTMGPNSFVFAYIFTKKCPRRRSTPPPTGARPPTGNPGSATVG